MSESKVLLWNLLFWNKPVIYLMLLYIVYCKEKSLFDAYNVGLLETGQFPSLQGLYSIASQNAFLHHSC